MIFRYLGGIENNIARNKNDIDNLFENLIKTKENTAKYINNNTNNISDVETFLESHLDYQTRTKILISEKDL